MMNGNDQSDEKKIQSQASTSISVLKRRDKVERSDERYVFQVFEGTVEQRIQKNKCYKDRHEVQWKDGLERARVTTKDERVA
jgi:hypothetical protein